MPSTVSVPIFPLLALCAMGEDITGLALDAGAPLDAARPCRLEAVPDGSAAPVDDLAALAALAGFSRPPVCMTVGGDAEALLSRLRERVQPLPVRSLVPLPSGLPRTAAPGEATGRDSTAKSMTGAVLRLCAIARMTTGTVLDPCSAFILGLLSLPGAARRAEDHGLTLLWLDAQHVYAALVFRGSLYALARLSFPALFRGGEREGTEALVRTLDDFRLGWLPGEEAERLDGAAWSCGGLPPEAEGFKPLFATGPRAGALEGLARIMPGPPEHILCRGLLYGGRYVKA